jgi:nucleoside-diphosphate-sugar epimerase
MMKLSSTLKENKFNIFITGASGFIGGHLSNFLQERHNVYNLVRTQKSSNSLRNVIIADLRKKGKVRTCLAELREKDGIHIIMHLASRLASANEIDDLNILHDNLKITEAVINIAKILKPQKIINFSSIAVYPNKDGIYSEASEIKTSVNSECLYGLSKFCSENMLDFLLRKEKIIISHLRISQAYGEGMRQDRIISMMIKELKEKNCITVFGNGKRISNFISIEKVLDIVNFFINNETAGIFNVGDENLSYLELAKRVIGQYGNRRSKIVLRPDGSRAKFYLNTGKINKLLIPRKH